MTKRYGSGSMVEAKPGKWYLRVYLGRDARTGRPRQRQVTFNGTEKQAGRELARLVTKEQDEKVAGTASTVGQLLDAWLKHSEPTRRPSTILAARRKINNAIRPALGDRRLSKLTAHDLDQFYTASLARGLSPTTVRQYHAILSAALKLAERWDWLAASPAGRASPPAVARTQMSVPTPAELRELIERSQHSDPLLASAIALAALTGVRRGELVALRWSDFDLSEQMLTVARSLTIVKGERHEGPTKTHQVRRVELDDLAVSVLQLRAVEQADRSKRAGSPLVDDPYVLSFSSNGSEPVSPDTLTHRFRKLCDGRWRFHDLRHFSVTTMIGAGVDIRAVSEYHGHADATMTLNRYAHALPERKRAGAEAVGRALKPRKKQQAALPAAV